MARGGARPNTGGKREGSGRKEFKPTPEERKQVEAMAGYGLPHEHIGQLIRDGIHRDTVCKYFEKELERGKAKANLKIGQTLFQRAVNGDTTAAIWWSKTQMKWSETKTHDVNVNTVKTFAEAVANATGFK